MPSPSRGAGMVAVIPALLIAALQQTGSLTLGSASARPGQASSGFIEVPVGSDAATRIPITIVRGAQSGPTLALIAGTHGSEVAPIVALQRVRAIVDPAVLRGTVLIVHVANMPSFLGRTIYYSPIDGKNLNRVYPGKADGTVSERIAYAITSQIIERADYLVDIHCGDGNESLRPYSYWSPLGLNARADSIARDMALAWGSDHIVVDTMRPRDVRASVYTQNTAQLPGKPSIPTETGYLGIPAEDMVQRNVDGVFRLLRYFHMVPGDVELVRQPLFFERTEVLRSPATGVWHARVERGQSGQKGSVIGVRTDFFGNSQAEIRAPFGGIVVCVVARPALSQGEPMGMVGEQGLER